MSISRHKINSELDYIFETKYKKKISSWDYLVA